MNKIYILHSGAKIIEDAISNCKYKDKIVMFNPTIDFRIIRALRKIHCKSKLKSKNIWVDNVLNRNIIENEKGNVMIIFDAPIWIENIEYIIKKYNNIKIVFWFWNIVKNERDLEKIKMNIDSIFTFDKIEAKKYGLEYNPQFYWIKENSKGPIETDLFFVGRNKERLSILETIYLECIKKNLKPNFYVVKDNKKDKSNYIELKEKSISYSEVLKSISKSKCILDINQVGQTGLTLRVLEALFLKKKLITNNKDLKNYEFFNKNNILILGEKFEIDSNFIDSKFIDVAEEIIEKYTVDSWIKTLTGI